MKKYILLIILMIIAGLQLYNMNHIENGSGVEMIKYAGKNSVAAEKSDEADMEGDNEAENGESEIVSLYEEVQRIDFTAKQPEMDITPYENSLYLEAYLQVLKNERLLLNGKGEEVYYRDLWRAGTEFDKLLEEKNSEEFPYLYYYDDLDGDGKPEFAINQSCMYIINYEPADDICSILYSQESCYFKKIIGTGQIWYHDGLHAGLYGGIMRDRLIILSAGNEPETVLDLEEGVSERYPYYGIGTANRTEIIYVDKDDWVAITGPFFEMAENNEIPQRTLEEIFGQLLEDQVMQSSEN